MKTDFITELFSLQQDDLIFRAQINRVWEYVRQTNGLAMGMPATPNIANLYATWYEKRLPTALLDRMLLFKRYIDDIICVVYTESLDHCEQVLRDFPKLDRTVWNGHISIETFDISSAKEDMLPPLQL